MSEEEYAKSREVIQAQIESRNRFLAKKKNFKSGT
jgi:hypothetical protein